jgi:hypothetical protein
MLSHCRLDMSVHRQQRSDRPHPSASPRSAKTHIRKVKFKRWGNKTASQARQTFALFGKSLNHDDLSCISQKDLSDFKDLLLGLSPTYGKSREDKDLTAAQLLAKGAVVPPGKRGVGVDATNRHLNFRGQLIKSIQAQGFAVDSALNPAAHRTQESADPMDEVLP